MAKKRPSGPSVELTKGERTRQTIVEASAPIFNQRGYEGSSINDLMEATGLKKGGIYRHFPSKEALAAAAFDYTWDLVWSWRISKVDKDASGLERVKQLVGHFVTHRPPVSGGCPVLNTAVEADDGNLDVLRARALKALNLWVNWVRHSVAEAVETGEARPDTSPEEVAMIVVALLEGALMMSRLKRSDLPLRHAQRHLMYYLDHEIAKAS